MNESTVPNATLLLCLSCLFTSSEAFGTPTTLSVAVPWRTVLSHPVFFLPSIFGSTNSGPARGRTKKLNKLGPHSVAAKIAGPAARQTVAGVRGGQDKTKLHRNNEICSPQVTSSSTNQTPLEQHMNEEIHSITHSVHLRCTYYRNRFCLGNSKLQQLDAG